MTYIETKRIIYIIENVSVGNISRWAIMELMNRMSLLEINFSDEKILEITKNAINDADKLGYSPEHLFQKYFGREFWRRLNPFRWSLILRKYRLK
jgi:hypothetical protein